MAVTGKVLVDAKYAENAQTTQYTAGSGVVSTITRATATNGSGAAVTFAVNLVVSGGSAGASNKVLSRTIAAGECYHCPELIGQKLEAGDFISTLAGTASALVIRICGDEAS